MATLGAILLTMLSICFASLGVWRLGADLGWTGDFVLASGFLSHWLVWFGLAVGAQYGSGRLSHYAALTRVHPESIPEVGDSAASLTLATAPLNGPAAKNASGIGTARV